VRSKISTPGRITILLGKHQATTSERMSPRKLAEKAGVPSAGNGSRYDRMMQFINPTAPKAEQLYTASFPHPNEETVPHIVDWSFPGRDSGQPGGPADWVKKQVGLFERKQMMKM
jgi:hypothetical protein